MPPGGFVVGANGFWQRGPLRSIAARLMRALKRRAASFWESVVSGAAKVALKRRAASFWSERHVSMRTLRSVAARAQLE